MKQHSLWKPIGALREISLAASLSGIDPGKAIALVRNASSLH